MPFTPPVFSLGTAHVAVCRLPSPVPAPGAAVPPPLLGFAGDFCGGTVWAPERAERDVAAEGDSRGGLSP